MQGALFLRKAVAELHMRGRDNYNVLLIING